MNNMFKMLGMAGFFGSGGGSGGGGSSGPVKWEDIQDKPFYGSVTEAPLDIQWDGQIGDRFSCSMGNEGMYFVKLTDAVLTAEQLKSSTVSVTIEGNGTQEVPLSADDSLVVDNTDMGAMMVMDVLIVSVYDPDKFSSAAAAQGMNVTVTKGTYSVYGVGITDLRLWSDTVTIVDETIVPLPVKYLPEIPLNKLPDSVQPVIYTEAVAAEIIPEQELTDSGNGVAISDWIDKPPADGTKWTVTLDGTAYTCTAVNNEYLASFAEEGYAVIVGNGALIMGGENATIGLFDTGEPFVFVFYADDGPRCMFSDTSVAHTVQVNGFYFLHHEIPFEYMRKPITLSFALDESHPNDQEQYSKIRDEIGEIIVPLKYGVPVYSTYKGAKVRVVAASVDAFGDWTCFTFYDENGWRLTKISVAGGNALQYETVTNVLSAGYETDHIVLKSSTSGSTKKFKVTIDDNGQLTPTEITT